jgi:hypothetical protein
MTMAQDDTAITIAREWLTTMQGFVRAIDYDGARGIFRDDVVGFGTYGGVLDGLDTLVAGQWSNVWPTIRDFTFRLDEVRAGREGNLLWLACPFSRPGRMTTILIFEDGQWRAAHTHFSLYPPTAKV